MLCWSRLLHTRTTNELHAAKGTYPLTRQANNIVSFDEARRAERARRLSVPEVGQRGSAGRSRGALYDERAYREEARSGSRSARGRQAAAADERNADQSFEDFFGKMGERAQKAKRQAAKSKADKAFTQQYGADRAVGSDDSGPRAAVYKAEMGSQHRRASRMQESGAGAFSGVALPNIKVPSLAGRSVLAGALTLVVGLFMCAAFLYEPAQQFYLEMRDRDRLVVEYEAVSARNEAIESEVAALSTPEGIQDRARQEFGWVAEGEYAVSVTGIEPKDGSASFQATINAASIQAPDTWYSDVLDPFFGYE